MTQERLTDRELDIYLDRTDPKRFKRPAPRPLTYEEIGQKHGITRERVRQIVLQIRAKGYKLTRPRITK